MKNRLGCPWLRAVYTTLHTCYVPLSCIDCARARARVCSCVHMCVLRMRLAAAHAICLYVWCFSLIIHPCRATLAFYACLCPHSFGARPSIHVHTCVRVTIPANFCRGIVYFPTVPRLLHHHTNHRHGRLIPFVVLCYLFPLPGRQPTVLLYSWLVALAYVWGVVIGLNRVSRR